MSAYVAALATDLVRLEARLDARVDALDTKFTARLDTVVLQLGKAFGPPAN
jgi:hypothetical protein